MFNNNTNSSSFGSILFFVILFIGMGLLIYYAVDITDQYRELEATMERLQSRDATLSTEIADIKQTYSVCMSDNVTYQGQIAAMTDEINRLKAELEKALAEIAAYKASSVAPPPEMGALINEINNLKLKNQQLSSLSCGSVENSRSTGEILHSTILPSSPEFWKALVAITLVEAIFLLSYALHKLDRDARRRKAAVSAALHTRQSSSRKTNTTGVIDSRFIDR